MASLPPEEHKPASRPKYVWSRLSPTVWKIVEYDPYGEYPFMYLLEGADRLLLLDTGCGTGDLLSFVTSSELNPQQLPIYIVCTHSHFDHIGCNWQFSGAGGKAACCAELAFGAVDKQWTETWGSNPFSFGERVKGFKITKWLADGEVIRLGPGDLDSVRVLFTPGHTPDQIALYYAKERWDAYQSSVTKLMRLVEEEEAAAPGDPPVILCSGHIDDFLPAKAALGQFGNLVAGIKDGSLAKIRNTALGMEFEEYKLGTVSIAFLPEKQPRPGCCNLTER
ncbi:hypothetical protein KFL_001190020 [Klebsormidium nitens]|uniref:Metallo-beta-lactamase domain-containing protein n=1 Tax=Klebsormidium nitens TaxID=105231 RepID=A0A0U9HS41_KLENI|nr:hypothetical protein KFL_001190020 [Klebsormidium nitens]|eukprot:GAQ82659.1 hypothetical protein KFL_001190020 [Klebsormidium nitens]